MFTCVCVGEWAIPHSTIFASVLGDGGERARAGEHLFQFVSCVITCSGCNVGKLYSWLSQRPHLYFEALSIHGEGSER